jgi:hypothetical protein
VVSKFAFEYSVLYRYFPGNTCATFAGLIAVPFSGLVLERTAGAVQVESSVTRDP